MKLSSILKNSIGALLLAAPFLLRAQESAPPIVSPDVQKDNSVIFRLLAPEADTVKLGGTMNADYSEVVMTKNDAGVYKAK